MTLTATELAYLVLAGEVEGLRIAARELQPKTIGANGSAGYRKALSLYNRACKRAGDAFRNLSAESQATVDRALSKAASVVL